MTNILAQFSGFIETMNPNIFILIMIWTIPWKGVALWMAARKNDRIWFVVLLLANTIGILEILYIFIFSKRKMK